MMPVIFINTIDVDVCDHSCLTGTGAVTIGGLSFYDL